MRPNGVIESPRSLLPGGHLCWAYSDRSEFLTLAGAYASDGVAAGQWIEYVGDAAPDSLFAEFAALAGEEIIGRGGFGVTPVEDFYAFDGSGVVDTRRSIAMRMAAMDKARANGWIGFRSVIDATSVARTPVQREAFARFEHLIDAQLAALPDAAMCAYDRELGEHAIAELACLHPWARAGASPFRLFAAGGDALALAGEVDAACEELFATALRRVPALSGDGRVVFDAQDMVFMDHHGLLALDGFAADNDVTVVLRGCSSALARVAALLGLGAVKVETAS